MASKKPITPKERDFIERAQMVAQYVDEDQKIIGVQSTNEKSRAANNSKAIKELKKQFGYKIQMIIPD